MRRGALFLAHPLHRCTGGAAGIGKETALQYARSKCVFLFRFNSSAAANHPGHHSILQSETRAGRPQQAWSRRCCIRNQEGRRVCLAALVAAGVASYVPETIREAIGLQCDVTSWEDQLRLFEAAIDAYHSVDIVVRYRYLLWSPSPRLIAPPRLPMPA